MVLTKKSGSLKFLFLSVYIIVFSNLGYTQKTKKGLKEMYQEKSFTEDGYTYTTVTNDPLNTRIYTLANGLKVYLSVYEDAPRVQTYIAVKAGSKNDPSTATGLAHYLEHILFKGTSKIGTSDWEKESKELQKIEALYEVYRNERDEKVRKNLYHQIDSISLVAASYAVANEYDKLLSGIGASGTNAYTFVEQTVYVNDIPANQLEKWAEIEGERFSEVVPRLFHTELEAVYEEKNKGMDQDQRKIWEQMLASLFQKHPYGTQTTIGTVEHLKNPSIKEIKKYFETYYVPNNMGIFLSGDLDPQKTIKIIDRNFGHYKPKPVPKFSFTNETPLKSPIKKEIYGPDSESITLGYRLPGTNEKSSLVLEMISMILSNGQAGLIDLNLNQKQKVLTAHSYSLRFNDYSVLMLSGKPREGQKLEEVKDLLLSQIQLVKEGKFEDWLLKAIINDYKISKMRQFESNKARADAMVEAFISGKKWAEYISETDQLAALSKQDIINVAKGYFLNNYVEIQKLHGTDTSIEKVVKPVISAVSVNREKESEFYKRIVAKPSGEIEPVFLDYTKDLTRFNLKDGIEVVYKQNLENDIFSLNFVIDIGKDHDPRYALAAKYMDYVGVKKFNAEELKKEFYKLGSDFGVSASSDAIYITLSGLNENFIPSLKLLEEVINRPVADESALKDMVNGILKARADQKMSKDVILKSAMVSYAKYGPKSPFTNILSENDLKNLNADSLVQLIKALPDFKHRVLYYGPLTMEDLSGKIKSIHHTPEILKDVPPEKKFDFQDIQENLVYFVDYDMVQAEVIFLSKSVAFDKKIVPPLYLFNEYFGGGMGSLVFQEMRESKALAYSVNSRYQTATRKDDPNYIVSYIGTQADKIDEAIEGLQELLGNMPQSDNLLTNAKEAIVESINTQRVTKASILMNYEGARKLGLDTDIRKDVYDAVKTMSFKEIQKFHENYIKGQKQIILVIGSKKRIDFNALQKYGKVRELTLKEIFGY